MNVEPLLDPRSPIHVLIVLGLVISGGITAWLGLRDGFIRREMRTNSGVLTGPRAILAGSLYLASGIFALAGGVLFFLKARGGG